MANNNRFITTRSNYTIKEPRKKIGDSTIFERDYMTTTNLGGFDSGTIPYGEGNFKIITTTNRDERRKHKSGDWLSKNDCKTTGNDTESCITWTLNDLEETQNESTENKIVPKQGYKDLLDFVYFGSCVELLKVSVNNIISKYPAELYFTNQKFEYIKDGKDLTMGYVSLNLPLVLDNPFNIDIISQTRGVEQKSETYNKLRYFYESFTDYMLLNEEDEEVSCLVEWNVSVKKNKNCYVNGDLIATIDLRFSNSDDILTIYAYFFNNKTIFMYDGAPSKVNENNETVELPSLIGYKIRPRKMIVNKIFGEDFSEFENYLLNKNSTPKYTVTIKTPTETNRGIVYSMRNYTWPTINKWNLDILSPTYNNYIQSLIEIASFYDEYKTDNLWKNMIHDSIKNLDVSMNTLKKIDEDVDDYIVGTGNIRGLMLAYGKQFDDLKLAIDNIKRGNSVTYDENNNLPDYFLSDTLNLSGWEVSSIVDTFDKNTTYRSNYGGENKTYDLNSVNTHFLRMLKINSRAIFSRKGTRNGIEMLLSLFGLCSYEFGKNRYNALPSNKQVLVNGKNIAWESLSEGVKSEFYDYKLDEYVAVASSKDNKTEMVDIDDQLSVELYNSYKKDAASEFNLGGVSGLPAKIVNVSFLNNKTIKYGTTEIEGEEVVTQKYIVPWFEKGVEYDGNLYFQMYGGWCQNENDDYEETKQYLRVVSKINDLLAIPYSELTNGTIIYVNDIENIGEFIKGALPSIGSHYFNLNDRNYSNLFTDIQTGNGWFNIPQSDIDDEIRLGIKVSKLEKIIETSIGNNPHVGYGIYDSGEEYLNYFKELFKGAIDNDGFTDLAYDCQTGLIIPKIKNTGFNLEKVVDNMKCWFFTDNTNTNSIYRLSKKYVDAEDNYGAIFENLPFGYEEKKYISKVNVGKKAKNEVFFGTNLEAYNFEDNTFGDNDEASANSIINVKTITLEFNHEKYSDNPEFKKFLHKAILPYLKQMIPSTTILKIKDIDQGIEITEC